jgi:hypothetical protein
LKLTVDWSKPAGTSDELENSVIATERAQIAILAALMAHLERHGCGTLAAAIGGSHETVTTSYLLR